jgi:hypothetical protein
VKVAANVETAAAAAAELAERTPQTEYPHRPKVCQTVVWKEALTSCNGLLGHHGGQRPPLALPLPAEYHSANVRRVGGDPAGGHHELCPAGYETLPRYWLVGTSLGSIWGGPCGGRDHHPPACARRPGRMLRACNNGATTSQRAGNEPPLAGLSAPKRLKTQGKVSAKLYRQRATPAPGGAQVVDFARPRG